VEGADSLGLIAEVGIAVAGFAGVVSALRAPGGAMGGYAAMRIGILFGTSAQAVLLALLPFGLHFAGVTDAATWTISSCAMAVLVATFWLAISPISLRVLPAARQDRAPGVLLAAGINIGTGAGIILLQLANAMIFRELWPLYFGLLALTALSLFQFAYVLFAPSRVEVQA
jgi:hypothetical protein